MSDISRKDFISLVTAASAVAMCNAKDDTFRDIDPKKNYAHFDADDSAVPNGCCMPGYWFISMLNKQFESADKTIYFSRADKVVNELVDTETKEVIRLNSSWLREFHRRQSYELPKKVSALC